MTTYQTAIFREGTAHQIFLEFTVREAVTSLPGEAPVDSAMDGGEQLVASGGGLLRGLESLNTPPDAIDFTRIEGAAGFAAPATQRDLFVWLHGEKRDELFARALEWRDRLRPVADLTHEDHGFRFRDSRDLTGFVDGSANPKGDAQRAAALIQTGEHAGGSFVLAQRWVHDMSGFSKLPMADQERVIGLTGDGLHDHLLHFSRPVTGSFFYAPPRDTLLRAFGR